MQLPLGDGNKFWIFLLLGASEEEIRRSYKDLARKWHPDKQDGSVGSDEATEVVPYFCFKKFVFQGQIWPEIAVGNFRRGTNIEKNVNSPEVCE